MSSRIASRALVALLAVAMAGTASAEVFVTSPSTGRILVLDNNGAVTRVIGGPGGMTEPFALAVDSGRNLLVADYATGRVVRYNSEGTNASLVASNIPKPDGLSVGPAGDIFLVSRDNRTAAPKLRSQGGDPGDSGAAGYLHQVWMVPSGSSLPVAVGAVNESFRLTQTLTAPSGSHAGDLLVLSSRPGLVARFVQSGPTSFDRSTDLISYVPGEPTSMAFARSGELLVSTSDGRILRYSDTGARLQPDFATALPVGPTRLSINMDGVIHLTPVGSTSIIRFDPYAMRLPDLAGATAPLATAVTTGCVPTPVGQNVAVSPAAGVNVIFDNVTLAGQTCLQTTSLGAGITTTPLGNSIPGYARKLWEDPGFIVYNLTTTAKFTDTIAEEFFSSNVNARLMVAHGTNGVFADDTVLVVPLDPRGRTGGLSEFVIYLDTRPNNEVVLQKLTDLQNSLNTYASVIDPDLLSQLQNIITQLPSLIGNGGADSNRPAAVDLLRGLKSFVRLNSGEGIRNTPTGGPDDTSGNAAGGIISFADTLIFQLSL